MAHCEAMLTNTLTCNNLNLLPLLRPHKDPYSPVCLRCSVSVTVREDLWLCMTLCRAKLCVVWGGVHASCYQAHYPTHGMRNHESCDDPQPATLIVRATRHPAVTTTASKDHT